MYIPSPEQYGFKKRRWFNPLRLILGKWYLPQVELEEVSTTTTASIEANNPVYCITCGLDINRDLTNK